MFRKNFVFLHQPRKKTSYHFKNRSKTESLLTLSLESVFETKQDLSLAPLLKMVARILWCWRRKTKFLFFRNTFSSSYFYVLLKRFFSNSYKYSHEKSFSKVSKYSSQKGKKEKKKKLYVCTCNFCNVFQGMNLIRQSLFSN